MTKEEYKKCAKIGDIFTFTGKYKTPVKVDRVEDRGVLTTLARKDQWYGTHAWFLEWDYLFENCELTHKEP